MAEGLNFKVGADISQPLKAIDILQKQSERLGKLLSLPNLTFQQYTRLATALQTTQRQMANLSKANEIAKNAIKDLGPGANQASLALGNLGRVAQDAPFGFLGISNNINPLLESFQRLKASTGSTGSALKALGSSLAGAGGVGLAVSLVTSALVVFGDQLGITGATFKKADFEAANFKLTLDRIAEGAEALKARLDFSQQLRALRFEVARGRGDALDLFNLDETKKTNKLFSAELDAVISKVNDQITELTTKIVGRGGEATDLFSKFLDPAEIPSNLISKLNNTNQQLFEALKSAGQKRKELQKQQTDALSDNAVITLREEVKRADIQRDLQKKAAEDYQKYVDDIIAKGKRLADELKNIAKVPYFAPLDSKAIQFSKAITFIDAFKGGRLTLTGPGVLDIAEPPDITFAGRSFEEIFSTELQNAFNKPIVPSSSALTADTNFKVLQKFKDEFKRFGADIPKSLMDNLSLDQGAFLTSINDALAKTAQSFQIAQTAANAASTAFGSAFDALLSGQSAIQAITSALKQLVIDFIKASIQALIFKTIGNLLAPGAGSIGAGALGGIIGQLAGARAEGGPVRAGKTYLVGEKGAELFTPTVSGSITSNSSLGSMGRGPGIGGTMHVVVSGRLRGKDQVLQQNRTVRSQNGIV